MAHNNCLGMKSLITVRGMLSYNDRNIVDSARPLRKDNNENTTMWSTPLATMSARVFDYDTLVNCPIVGLQSENSQTVNSLFIMSRLCIVLFF